MIGYAQVASERSPIMTAKNMKEMQMCRVFVIDDESSIVELIRFNLEKTGHSVFTFNNVDDALGQMEQIKPSAVILDLNMPGKNGDAFLTPFVTNNCACIVYTCMFLSEEETLDLLRKGASWVLTKPISAEIISEYVLKAQIMSYGARILRKVERITKAKVEGLRNANHHLAQLTASMEVASGQAT